MVFLHDARDLDRAVAVHHPVQVDAEDGRIKLFDELLDVEPVAPEHAHGQVHDAHAVAGALQVLRDAGDADRVQLEDGSGGHLVAGGAVEYGLPAEVVHAGRVEQYQVGLGHVRFSSGLMITDTNGGVNGGQGHGPSMIVRHMEGCPARNTRKDDVAIPLIFGICGGDCFVVLEYDSQ